LIPRLISLLNPELAQTIEKIIVTMISESDGARRAALEAIPRLIDTLFRNDECAAVAHCILCKIMERPIQRPTRAEGLVFAAFLKLLALASIEVQSGILKSLVNLPGFLPINLAGAELPVIDMTIIPLFQIPFDPVHRTIIDAIFDVVSKPGLHIAAYPKLPEQMAHFLLISAQSGVSQSQASAIKVLSAILPLVPSIHETLIHDTAFGILVQALASTSKNVHGQAKVMIRAIVGSKASGLNALRALIARLVPELGATISSGAVRSHRLYTIGLLANVSPVAAKKQCWKGFRYHL
jgi:hypothetical protein